MGKTYEQFVKDAEKLADGNVKEYRNKDDRIAIQVSITRSFEEGQGVTWATTLPQSASLKEINDTMDKIWTASSRQSKLHRIDRIDKEIEHNVQQLAQLQFSLAILEKDNPDLSKVSSDVKSAFKQTTSNIIRFKTLNDELRSEQRRMREELKVT